MDALEGASTSLGWDKVYILDRQMDISIIAENQARLYEI
jgi:hypothetical protein